MFLQFVIHAHGLSASKKRRRFTSLFLPKAHDRRSAAKRSEVRREAVGSQFQRQRQAMRSRPAQGFHSKSSFRLSQPLNSRNTPSLRRSFLNSLRWLFIRQANACLIHLLSGALLAPSRTVNFELSIMP